MLKTMVASLFVAGIMFASTAGAEDWNSLGPVTTNPHHNDTFVLNSGLAKTGQLFFDADSLVVDKANNTVEFVLKDTDAVGYIVPTYAIMKLRLHFFSDPKQCYVTTVYRDTFIKSSNKLLYHETGDTVGFKDFSKGKRNYFFPYVMWKEFGYYLDLPNQDGKPYDTPKALGLTWGASSDHVGIFYDAKSLKVKGNKVKVVAYMWWPKNNRYQLTDGIFDYDIGAWRATYSETRRISSGDVVKQYEAPYGKEFEPKPFNSDPDIQFAADYFRKFL